jgi:hypothetical protein
VVPVIAAAILSGGCSKVSDMLGLSSKKAPADAPVETPDPATADASASSMAAQPATTAATVPTAPKRTSGSSSGSARKRASEPAVTADAGSSPAPVNTPSPEVALVDSDPELQARVAATPGTATAPVVTSARPPASEERRIYSSEDADVVPARLIKAQTSGPVFRNMASSVNTMELIISKQGRVEEAKLVSPTRKLTDMLLLSGAKTWKFVPATRNGQPVRYRTQFSWEETP